MRLRLTPSPEEGIVKATVEIESNGGASDPWEMGELKFTMDEWTKFIIWASSQNEETGIGFDILSEDGELVLL